jgi:hypothetical protein
MAVLNLRDVPDDLAHALRVEAVQAAMGIKDYCVVIFESRKKIADDLAGVVGENPACAPRGKREYGDYFPVIDTTPVEDKGKVLAELRGLVAGIKNNVMITPTMGEDGNFEAQEIDLCWRKEYNPDTGQTGACGLEKGHKGKCGAWEVVE